MKIYVGSLCSRVTQARRILLYRRGYGVDLARRVKRQSKLAGSRWNSRLPCATLVCLVASIVYLFHCTQQAGPRSPDLILDGTAKEVRSCGMAGAETKHRPGQPQSAADVAADVHMTASSMATFDGNLRAAAELQMR